MDHPFFTNLPSEIITNILSSVPVKTIGNCKCVCKSWLELLETPEFAKSHLSKSVPDLIVYHDASPSTLFRIFEFVDELELESHELHYNPAIEFDPRAFISPPHAATCMQGSANGLLFLCGKLNQSNALYVCNPITHEYIQLPCLDPYEFPIVVVYGFGISMVSGQYKVVRILHDSVRDPATDSLLSIPKSECRVYTLGTGVSWRSTAHCPAYDYNICSTGAFISGNLHWLVADLNDSLLVSRFDLEMELFNFFTPPLPGSRAFEGDLVVFEDCLCICDNTSENELVIWEMKEYGIENSWTKQFVISKLHDLAGQSYACIYPLKIFKDGDILLLLGDFYMLYYSSKTKTTPTIELFELHANDRVEARLHVSSFLSLKIFAMETVSKY